MKTKWHATRYSSEKSVSSSKKPSIQERRQLDREYLQLREVICNTEFYRSTTRHNRIRLNLWSAKLDQIVADVSWKRNRNNYIKLMYLMTQSEVIVEPLANLPPEGELPFLRNYQINAIVDMVDNKVNQKIAKFGYCRHCMADQKQRNLPFHLSTPRQLKEFDEETFAQGLTQCTHPCLHPKQQNKGNYLVKFQSNTTREAFSFSENNINEVDSVYQNNENELNFNNQTSTNMMRQGKQKKRQALKQIVHNNNQHQTKLKYAQNSASIIDKSSSESQGDLQQNVRVCRVKVFGHLTMRQKR